MKPDTLFAALDGLRRYSNDLGVPAQHKPVLLLWLFDRLAERGSSEVGYADAHGPVGALINKLGGPRTLHRAADPFLRLERTLWQLSDRAGAPIPVARGVGGPQLLERGAVGRLRPEVEHLLRTDPDSLDEATRRTWMSLTPEQRHSVVDSAPVDPLSPFEQAVRTTAPRHRAYSRLVRDTGFRVLVLTAYRNTCAICGYDGLMGGQSVGLEAAHLHGHAAGGPDRIENGLALCVLHHRLLDSGAIGLTPDRTVVVSSTYRATSAAGQAVLALAGTRLADPVAPHPPVSADFIRWHTDGVFRP
ncbi:phosphorothioated DNA-binding restriction endonuclease [Kitasatospora sp. NPDC002040]|uniref:phosphorothioated DNA-binding restriction endonuclease n=1 Tax=Kitasatospora sp. NPDC002040 TaxID=3154661 RepID=UPI00333194CA